MGVNICLYQIDPRSKKEIKVKEFDSMCFVGDVDFIRAGQNFGWIDLQLDECDYCRPQNIVDAMDWVKQNIREENQTRLIKVLTDMYWKSDLWFYFSY